MKNIALPSYFPQLRPLWEKFPCSDRAWRLSHSVRIDKAGEKLGPPVAPVVVLVVPVTAVASCRLSITSRSVTVTGVGGVAFALTLTAVSVAICGVSVASTGSSGLGSTREECWYDSQQKPSENVTKGGNAPETRLASALPATAPAAAMAAIAAGRSFLF